MIRPQLLFLGFQPGAFFHRECDGGYRVQSPHDPDQLSREIDRGNHLLRWDVPLDFGYSSSQPDVSGVPATIAKAERTCGVRKWSSLYRVCLVRLFPC